MGRNKSAVFLDVNVFAYEEFTSGLFITIREVLRRISKKGIKINILSVAQGIRSKYWHKEHTFGQRERIIQGIPVKEILLENAPEKDLNSYLVAVRKLLSETKPDLIIMNTPAVFLDEINVAGLKEVINTKTKVVILVVDDLFPTAKTYPREKVESYYNLVRKTEVVVNSKLIRENLYKETGIHGKIFPNLLSYKDIISKKGKHEYITLINHHPIKGREIFNAIVKKMPSKKFMIVENWPDVPPYIPPARNVRFSKFIQNPSTLYGKIRILLVPSLCQEGPARVVMEALLNGIPVIAHRIGSISEIGGKHIRYINPPSKISCVLGKTIVYPKISKSELERVSNDFVKAIANVDRNRSSWKRYSSLSQKYAITYCNKAEVDFLPFLKRWFT